MPIGAFEWILEAVGKFRVFIRNKVSVDVKVRSCIMYMAGLSYRGMTVMSGLVPVSHVSVYYWVKKLKGLVEVSKPRVRRAIAVDETVLKLDGDNFSSGRRWMLTLGRFWLLTPAGTGQP